MEIPPGGVDIGEGIALLEALDVKFLIFFPAPDLAEPTAVSDPQRVVTPEGTFKCKDLPA